MGTRTIPGRLATGLWLLLGGVVTVHMIGVTVSAVGFAAFATFSDRDIEESKSEVRRQLVEDSIGLIDGSAKTLYSFLTPLATAITGYYFSAVETEVEQRRSRKAASKSSDE